jgi:hypothetical protein
MNWDAARGRRLFFSAGRRVSGGLGKLDRLLGRHTAAAAATAAEPGPRPWAELAVTRVGGFIGGR